MKLIIEKNDTTITGILEGDGCSVLVLPAKIAALTPATKP